MHDPINQRLAPELLARQQPSHRNPEWKGHQARHNGYAQRQRNGNPFVGGDVEHQEAKQDGAVRPTEVRASVFGVPRLRGLTSSSKSLKSRPRREAAVKAELQTGNVRGSNHAILASRNEIE